MICTQRKDIRLKCLPYYGGKALRTKYRPLPEVKCVLRAVLTGIKEII